MQNICTASFSHWLDNMKGILSVNHLVQQISMNHFWKTHPNLE